MALYVDTRRELPRPARTGIPVIIKHETSRSLAMLHIEHLYSSFPTEPLPVIITFTGMRSRQSTPDHHGTYTAPRDPN